MKLGLLLLTALMTLPAFPAGMELGSVKSVYFLPMRSGFDQYLANHVTSTGVLQVVTNPENADAIFTDQIGLKFERQLEELYPPEPEPEEEEPAADESEAESEGEEESTAAEEEEEEEAAPEEEQWVPLSSFSRGKGNIFLVGRESRNVIWSTYHPPKDFSAKELNKAAERIIGQLQETLFGN
jgi:hypothetical protein